MNASGTRHACPAAAVPVRSELLVNAFRWWVRRYLRKHFHAVRLARAGRPHVPAGVPLVVVLNHPSWWDPLVGLLLAEQFPGRRHFAPMDALALDRYGFFRKLGFYGIGRCGVRGARGFLETTAAILSRPGAAVWVTAQGRFTDCRAPSLGLRHGVGHVARRLGRGVIVTLALEYPFWEERLPEALARFGRPVPIDGGNRLAARGWVERIESSLAAARDALAAHSIARDASAFEDLLTGDVAIGGVYDAWRRFRAWQRGEHFRPEHGTTGGRP